jgi:hypothetical protein
MVAEIVTINSISTTTPIGKLITPTVSGHMGQNFEQLNQKIRRCIGDFRQVLKVWVGRGHIHCKGNSDLGLKEESPKRSLVGVKESMDGPWMDKIYIHQSVNEDARSWLAAFKPAVEAGGC